MQSSTTTSLLESAITAQKEQNYFLAEELFREVLSISPNNSQALICLAALFINNEQPDVAIPLLHKAISIKKDNPDILYNLGLANQQANNLDDAIHCYKLVISLNPGFSQAYNNLGVAYQHQGKIELANSILEKAFMSSPEFVDAYYNYSQTYKYSNNDQKKIDDIEKMLFKPGLTKHEEIKLHFALGKIFDDLKQYTKAFEHYNLGNTLKDQGFNIEQYQKYIDKIIENFDLALINKLQNTTSKTDKRLIFVIGVPRSGTTLVEQIIEKHPEVDSAGESGFIGEIVDEFSNLLGSSRPYPDCINDVTPDDLHKISKNIQSHIDNLPHNSKIIVEKSPVNFLHVGLILLLFPDSLIIHATRQPVSTCLSCYFQNFNRQHQYSYNLENLAHFHNEYQRLMQHWKNTFKDKIFDINYEDLVKNQEYESRKLIAACSIEWDEKCLSFYNSNSVVNTASKWQVRRPIYKTSINKWENYAPFIKKLTNYLKH